MSGFTLRKCELFERIMSRKNKRQFHIKSVTLVIVKDEHRYQEEILVSKFYCQSCFVKNISPSEVNKFQTSNQNQSRNSLTNKTVTPDSNKSNFCNSCNSIELPFDDDVHHVFMDSKYFNTNEINALRTKENQFNIRQLHIASLNKHTDSISNLLSLINLNVPIIGLS